MSKTTAWLPVVTNRSLYNEPWGEVSCRSIEPSWPVTATLPSRATMSEATLETSARANSYFCLLRTNDKLAIDNFISMLTTSPSPLWPDINSHNTDKWDNYQTITTTMSALVILDTLCHSPCEVSQLQSSSTEFSSFSESIVISWLSRVARDRDTADMTVIRFYCSEQITNLEHY